MSVADSSSNHRLTHSATEVAACDGVKPRENRHTSYAAPMREAAGLTDYVLMRRIMDGDETALAAVYDRYSGLVYSVLRRIIGDSGSTEEVLQDIFFWLWRRASRFDPARGELAGLLVVVARNRAIDLLRRQRPGEFGSPIQESLIAPAFDLDSQVMQNELRLRVRLAVASLPQPQRAVLELAYFQGLTHREIARLTGDPLGTVKTRLRAALKALADVLDSAPHAVEQYP